MLNYKFNEKTITSINYSTNLSITTLEGHLHILHPKIQTIKLTTPLISSTTYNNTKILSNTNGTLIFLDLNTQKYNTLQTDCGLIENIHIYQKSTVCGGHNKQISLFNNTAKILSKYKIIQSALYNNMFVCKGERVCWAYDLRYYSNVVYEECLDNDIRCVALLNENVYMVGSVDGKIKVGVMDSEYVKTYESLLFVGHKKVVDGRNVYNPVEKIMCYNNRVLTCGDERIIEWDLKRKRRVSVLYRGNGKLVDMVGGDQCIYFVECENEAEKKYSVKSIDI